MTTDVTAQPDDKYAVPGCYDGPVAGVKFGIFQFDSQSLELTKGGLPLKLPPQPAQMLKLLLDARGEIVPRERFHEALWPAGTYVEFELGLNAAVRRLRRVLNDSASSPRYIETLPRIGYRFIAPVEIIASAPAPSPIPNPIPAPALPVPETEPPVTRTPQPRSRRMLATVLLAGLLLVAAVIYIATRGGASGKPPERSLLSLSLPAGAVITDLSVSPLGDHVVYALLDAKGRRAYRQFLGENFARRVDGSEDARLAFFSPDGLQLGIVTWNRIRVVSPDGKVRDVASIDGQDTVTVRWSADGYIYYSNGSGQPGVWRVSSQGGGTPEIILTAQAKPVGIEYALSQGFVGKNLLYNARVGPSHNELRLRQGDVTRTLHNPARGGMYGAGMLVYEDKDQLVAEPLDEKAPQLSGTRIVLAERVETRGWPGPMASMNASGMLAFLRDRVMEERKVVWVDRLTGARTETHLAPAEYEQVRVSPADANLAAVVIRTAPEHWTAGLVNLRTGARTELLSTPIPRPRMEWSHDGESLILCSERDNGDLVNLYRVQRQKGIASMTRLTEQPLFGQFPTSLSPSAAELLLVEGVRPGTKSDLKVYSFATGSVRPFLSSNGWDTDAVFSPDGRRVAYASDSSGSMTIYVRGYPDGVPKGIAEGRGPVWVTGEDRLLYAWRGKLMEVSLNSGEPRVVADGAGLVFDIWTRQFDVSPDGRRVLTVERQPPAPRQRVVEVIRDVRAEYQHHTR